MEELGRDNRAYCTQIIHDSSNNLALLSTHSVEVLPRDKYEFVLFHMVQACRDVACGTDEYVPNRKPSE